MEYSERRKLQSQATRKAILDAAVELAGQMGFQRMTIRDICSRAGVTTGAFYHHFSSKEDLLNQGFSSLDDYLESALAPYADTSPLERLEALLRLYAGYMEDLGWETTALYYSRRLADPAAETMAPQRYTLRAMRECLNALAESGDLSPKFDPDWTAQFFFRHFRGIVIDWALHRGAYSLWGKLNEDFQLFETAFRA